MGKPKVIDKVKAKFPKPLPKKEIKWSSITKS
jgi:hypothetical protein